MRVRSRRKTGILLSKEEKTFLEAAEEECFLRIRNDQIRSSPRIRSLLVYLEHHLYDQALTVTRWKSACNVRSNTVAAQFKEDLGATPYAYVTERRLETAAKLLLEPSPKVWQIAYLVGYSDPAVFSRAFLRWAKMRPDHFRRTEGAKERRSSRRSRYPRVLVEWRSAFAGEVELADLLARRDRFDEFCSEGPPRKEDDGTPGSRVEVESREERRAKRIWARTKDRSDLEQVALVDVQGDFETTALFDLLREKSREEARRDRRRGIAIAELALLSLKLCAEALGEDLPNREAQGWITLGNARRLTFDFIGSDRDFEIAENHWRSAKDPDPLVEAELCLYKAALCWFQRSFKNGSELVSRSIDLFHQLERPVSRAQALILKANIIEEDTGESKLAAVLLHEALDLLEGADEAYLKYTAFTGLARESFRLLDYASSSKYLSGARDLYRQELRCPFIKYQLLWLEALLQQVQDYDAHAITLFEQALHGFIELDEITYVAVVALDLAVSYTKQDRHSKAAASASCVIPVLESLQIRREAMAALRLLRDVVAKEKINVACLLEVRKFVESVTRDPVALNALAKHSKEGRALPSLLDRLSAIPAIRKDLLRGKHRPPGDQE